MKKIVSCKYEEVWDHSSVMTTIAVTHKINASVLIDEYCAALVI